MTENRNTAGVSGASEAMVQVMAPVPPAAGVVQLKVGPLVCEAETKVVPAGTLSVSVTLVASEGPSFSTVTS